MPHQPVQPQMRQRRPATDASAAKCRSGHRACSRDKRALPTPSSARPVVSTRTNLRQRRMPENASADMLECAPRQRRARMPNARMPASAEGPSLISVLLLPMKATGDSPVSRRRFPRARPNCWTIPPFMTRDPRSWRPRPHPGRGALHRGDAEFVMDAPDRTASPRADAHRVRQRWLVQQQYGSSTASAQAGTTRPLLPARKARR